MKILIRTLLILLAITVLSLVVSYMKSGGQTEIINTVQINKLPYDVVYYISDMRNELKWNPQVQHIEKKSDGSIETGTVFRVKWHQRDTIDVTITSYYPPYWVVFENGGPIEVIHRFDLSPSGEETILNSKILATPHGFSRAVFPVIKYKMKNRDKENLINLKKILESNG